MESNKSKIGLIDVGGGLRDIYGAGIEDYCMENGILFDYYLGISAGSANLSGVVAGQKGRSKAFYLEYAFRKQYISLRNYLRCRNYVDLDYAYGTLSKKDGESPLDYEQIVRNPAEFVVVACEAETGATTYFDKSDLKQDCYDILKASSSLPFINRPYPINGKCYFDGGLADPVPVEKAFADGCDKLVLILSRPRDYHRVPDRDMRFAKRIQKKYPGAAREFRLRAEKYNTSVQKAIEYEAKGKLLLLAPDDCMGVDTLTRDKEKLQKLYAKGFQDAERIRSFL